MSDRVEKIRMMTGELKAHKAEGKLAEVTCQRWLRNWPMARKEGYVTGLAYGLAWWMLWESEAARYDGRKEDEDAWERARQDITKDEALDVMQRELEDYCKTVIKESEDGLFLDGVPEAIWRVAKQYGAPLPELYK